MIDTETCIAPPKPEMVYREKKDYGRAPEYLVKVKKEIKEKRQKELLAQQVDTKPKDFVVLAEEERLRILDSLQKTWEKLNTEYQKLPLVIDTLPKITR